MLRYCLALDLREDPELIEEYKRYHRDVWPEVKQSLYDSGILDMEIYLVLNRLFMIIETKDDFTFEAKAAADLANPKVQEWETLMGRLQKPLPNTNPSQKWRWQRAEQVFKLKSTEPVSMVSR
jgi:L-rhamnose mutarotase